MRARGPNLAVDVPPRVRHCATAAMASTSRVQHLQEFSASRGKPLFDLLADFRSKVTVPESCQVLLLRGATTPEHCKWLLNHANAAREDICMDFNGSERRIKYRLARRPHLAGGVPEQLLVQIQLRRHLQATSLQVRGPGVLDG